MVGVHALGLDTADRSGGQLIGATQSGNVAVIDVLDVQGEQSGEDNPQEFFAVTRHRAERPAALSHHRYGDGDTFRATLAR